jgi:hypothetical protein
MEKVMKEYKTVTVTKKVPVSDQQSLAVWLDVQLYDYVVPRRDGGLRQRSAGTKAIELILEAGFTLNPPQV